MLPVRLALAGEHGKPSYGAFNVEQFNLCRQDVLEYQKTVITDAELRDCEDEESAHDRLELLLNLTPQTGVYWIGGDLGYTNAPTELVVFQESDVGERKVMKLILRLHMEHVAYPHIAQTLALLERYYTPVGIGGASATCNTIWHQRTKTSVSFVKTNMAFANRGSRWRQRAFRGAGTPDAGQIQGAWAGRPTQRL